MVKIMTLNNTGPAFSQELMAFGEKLDKCVLEATREMYLQLHKERLSSIAKIITNQPYGIDVRQCLDVHVPGTKD
jgi:hypothetical protein